jgi:GNAT superfamily N-acetyltransferase
MTMQEMIEASAVTLRDATPDDARALAELIAIAGAGIPEWLWSEMAAPGEAVFDVCERRARRDAGGFSWTNAIVAEHRGRVVGMILGYPLGPGDGDLETLPAILRPFAELELRVPGSWYINAFALREGWRSRGIGARLLAAATGRAIAAGSRQMSVQTFSATPRSEAFYRRHGFVRIDARALPDPSPCRYRGDTVLLVRDVAPAATA